MLTAYIVQASDRHYTVGVVELPEIRVTARNVAAIPEEVRAVAAKHTGMDPELFTIVVDY
ncbi:hypothetical protein [Pseudarthrobacter enclensis]|uniref:Uncharacterized protein n=1 Tax=Pseudarthrobacter enclensis TaxID=993070 RepID=A0A0V8I5D2_9MICC|nr:hypothetical protein [Pseudarthrobacter enclensis]KSU69999.1 hypothetical protein AS031_18245 [Pseudarthrobacter enclensis]